MESTYFDLKYIKDYDNLSDIEKQQILMEAIKDFYDRKITIYQLSDIGEFIWSSSENKNTELVDIAIELSELEHYLHEKDNNDKDNVSGKILDEIGKYYEKYRNRLVPDNVLG